MNFEYSDKCKKYLERLDAFMGKFIYPNEQAFAAEIDAGDRWQPSELIENLKQKAKDEGLWNLFLPDISCLLYTSPSPRDS